MVLVLCSENRRVADSLSTSVTVPKWNSRSWGFRLSRLPNLLYFGVRLLAWNGTWICSFRRKREGGHEAQRPVLCYMRPMVWHASLTVSWMALRLVESIASAKASFVQVGPSPLRHLTAVLTMAMQREKVKWQSPKSPCWRGA